MVKNTAKKYQKDHKPVDAEDKKFKLKIANGYKHLISRILREFLVNLAKKIEVYLQGTHIKTLRLEDLSKITRIWVNHEEAANIDRQLTSFESTVKSDMDSIEKNKSSNSSVATN